MTAERIARAPRATRLNPIQIAGMIRENFSRPPKAFTACQLMIYAHDFYDRHLRSAYHEMKLPYPRLIEDLICDRLLPFRGKPGIVLRWPINVEPSGMAGHASKKYDSPQRVLIRQARAVMRRVAPDVWF